jgi:hypothetical protein
MPLGTGGSAGYLDEIGTYKTSRFGKVRVVRDLL